MSSFHPSDRLSSGDASFLYLEKPAMPLHIGCVYIVEGVVPAGSLRALVESKLPLIPRYRQRVVVPPLNLGHPTWESDPAFDIQHHIRQVSLEHGTDRELQALAGQIFSQIMDRNHPLWDLTLVDGLESGCTAIISRVHHCLVDGVSGVALLQQVLDSKRTAGRLPKPQPFHVPRLPGATESLLDALISSPFEALDGLLSAQSALLDAGEALLRNQALAALPTLAGLLPDLLASLDRLPFNAPCRGPRQHAWTEIPIPEISAIREACGGTLNDVALAVVIAAVQKYARLRGQTVRNRLVRIMVPVNLRSLGEQPGVGNRVSAFPLVAPLDIPDPVELLHAVHAKTQSLKRSHLLDLVGLGMAWMGVVPAPFQAMFGMLGNVLPIPPFHLVCTNVPGPQFPLYLLGHELLRSYPYVPIGNDMGFCCAMQSYNGRLFIGLTADTEAAPDVDRIRGFVDRSFEELRDAAGVAPVRLKQLGEARAVSGKVPALPARKKAAVAAKPARIPVRDKPVEAAPSVPAVEVPVVAADVPLPPQKEPGETAPPVTKPADTAPPPVNHSVPPQKEPGITAPPVRKRAGPAPPRVSRPKPPQKEPGVTAPPVIKPAGTALPRVSHPEAAEVSDLEAGPELAEDIEAEPASVN